MRRRALLRALGLSSIAVRGQAAHNVRIAHRLDHGLRIVDISPDGDNPPLILVRSKEKAFLVRTDGGMWSQELLPEAAKSVATDGERIFIAGASGVWERPRKGRGDWIRRWDGEGLERIVFSGKQWFAAGAGKTLIRLEDDNQWRRVPAADEPSTKTAFTTYHWIHFVTERVGIVSGASRPPRGGRTADYPAWLDPHAEDRRKEWPGASVTLETRDGGKTWKQSVTSIFGTISRVRYARDGRGLALIQFHDAFDWPSEVFTIDLKTGSSERSFRRKDRAVTDTWLFPGSGYLVTIEPPIESGSSGRLGLFHSTDLRDWRELEIPEAHGNRAWLSGSASGALWIASDHGTLFHCTETPG